MPALPVKDLNIIPACREVASACGEGGCVAQMEIDPNCLFTTHIHLFTEKERPKCLVCLCLGQCSSPESMGYGSVCSAGKDLEMNERREAGVLSRY